MLISANSIRRLAALAGLSAASLLCLVGPAEAGAAPQGPWVPPPESLSEVGEDSDDPRIAIGPDGTETVIWIRDGIVQTRTRAPLGTFGPIADLSQPGANATGDRIAVGPDGTTTVIWSRPSGPNYIVQARTRPPGGSFGPVEDLSADGHSANLPQLSIGPDGTTTVVWYREDDLGDDIVQARTRPPGGSFGTVEDLSEGGRNARQPQVATGPDGTTAVVWQRANNAFDVVIQARTRPPGGSFGTVEDLSEGGEDASLAQVAVGPGGTATAVWRRDDGSNYISQTATRPAGGSFGTVEDLSEGGEDAQESKVAIGSDGTVTAVWRRTDGSNQRLQARTRPPGGVFGPVEYLSAAGKDSFGIRFATGPDGTLTVAWHQIGGPVDVVQARTRPPGGSFGAIADVSDTSKNSDNVDLAIGPDGKATAVWRGYDGIWDLIWTASTQAPEFPLSVVNLDDQRGTVTSAPAGIDCGSDCEQDYTSFTRVTLTAASEPGSRFTGWNGACSGQELTCELTMDEAKAVTAGFEADPPPPQPPEVCPPSTLKPGKLKKNRKRGTAKLAIRTGREGKVILKGSKTVKRASKKLGPGGAGKLPVKAKGKAARTLKKKGRVTIRVKLIYKPGGDCPNKTRTKKVRLVRK